MSMLENLQARERLPEDRGSIYSPRFILEVTDEYPAGQNQMVERAKPREWFIPEELKVLRSPYGRNYAGTERVLKQHDEWLHLTKQSVSATFPGFPSPFTHQPERFRLLTIDHTVRQEEFSGLRHAVEIVLQRQTADETEMSDVAALLFSMRRPDEQLFVVGDGAGGWTEMESGAECDYCMQRMLTVADLSLPERTYDSLS